MVCGEHGDKRQLVRIVRNKEGKVFLDRTSKANGRGAYICAKEECFEKACKGKFLDRAFKQEVPLDVYESLRKEMLNDKK